MIKIAPSILAAVDIQICTGWNAPFPQYSILKHPHSPYYLGNGEFIWYFIFRCFMLFRGYYG